jgi:hypothetical protein
MGDDIADCIDRMAGNSRKDRIYVPVEFPKGLLEELPVLFGKHKHQRTFSAYRPGSLIFMRFATSELSGSMITR